MSNYKKERPTRSCPYNSMVACKYVPEHTPPELHRCHRCGWNPEVAQKRLEKAVKPNAM